MDELGVKAVLLTKVEVKKKKKTGVFWLFIFQKVCP